LAHGPLLRAVLFEFGDGRPQRLLIVIHHLVVDGVSWRILLEDLWTAYRELSQAVVRPNLPAKTTSFKEWTTRLASLDDAILGAEVEYWLQQAAPSPNLPTDRPGGGNRAESARTLTKQLDSPATEALLGRMPKMARAEPTAVLLTALLLALKE